MDRNDEVFLRSYYEGIILYKIVMHKKMSHPYAYQNRKISSFVRS